MHRDTDQRRSEAEVCALCSAVRLGVGLCGGMGLCG